MNERTISKEEQDALVQVIIHKIPEIKEVDRLKELVHQALELMLHNPEDQALRHDLDKCAHDILAGIEFVPPSVARTARIRRSARDCVEVLLAAKEHRMPREIQYSPDVQAAVAENTANDNHHPEMAKAKAHTAPQPPSVNRILMLVFILVAAMAAIGGAAIWQNWHSDHDSVFAEAKGFTSQIFAVAAGADNMSNEFGGTIKRRVVEGRVNIIATKVPSRVCAASGWELVHKGTLTINGVTPRRVSSAIITDLCYGGGDDITLNWESKDLKVHPSPAAPQ